MDAKELSQGSDDDLMSDSQADRAVEELSQGSEAGVTTAPAVNPTLARAKGAAPLKPIVPSPITGAPLKEPPSAMRQPTGGTAAAAQMDKLGLAPTSADAPAADDAAAGPPAFSGAAAAGVPGLGGGVGEDDDEDEDEYLSPDERAKVEHVKKVEAVITDAEAAGFTFMAKSRWLAAEAYVNNKKLFDDAGVDITVCIQQGAKAINSKRVNAKVAELAAVEHLVVTTNQGGLSQEAIGEDESEEEEAEAESDDDEYATASKQTLDAKHEALTIELKIAEKKDKDDPIRLAFREFNRELITLKGSLQYDGKAKELTVIRDYYNEQYFDKDFVANLSVWQMEYMVAMWKAEIEKRTLPSTIKDLRKHLGKVTSALREIKFEQFDKQDAKRAAKTEKRTQAAFEKEFGTPGKRARRG